MSRTTVGWPTIPTKSAITEPTRCAQCGGAFSSDADMELIGGYWSRDRIPPVKPHVVRHRRFACRCAHCGAGMERKRRRLPSPRRTPFGPRIHALAILAELPGAFLRASALPVPRRLWPDRQRGRADEHVYPLHAGFEIEAEKAKSILRKARVVASDETGVRIEGTNSYHWVFHCKDAVVHQPDYSRGARVVEEMMGGHEPNVWISRSTSPARSKSSASASNLLARLAGVVYGFAVSMARTIFQLRFKLWFGKAFDLAADIAHFAASTIASKKRALENQLADILGAATECDLARRLQAKIGRAQTSF